MVTISAKRAKTTQGVPKLRKTLDFVSDAIRFQFRKKKKFGASFGGLTLGTLNCHFTLSISSFFSLFFAVSFLFLLLGI